MTDLIQTLKIDVKDHKVLKHPWLLSRSEKMSLEDLVLWLSQEYFVSIGFVDWFLFLATKTPDQTAKIVLVENIWEELGEGRIEESHVSILINFMGQLGQNHKESQILAETAEYLQDMQTIIERGFYFGLGALGPANEYLLKLEYSKIANSYQKLKENFKLPEGKFFQVNLNADEGHSKRIFELIERVALSPKHQNEVIIGNIDALNAREKFYFGLERVTTRKQ